MKSPDRKAIENSIHSGEVIRKHVMRPFWQLVHQNDIRCILEQLAPDVKKAMPYVAKNEGLTNELYSGRDGVHLCQNETNNCLILSQ